MSALIHINMKQFRERWRDYSDNIKFAETIRECNGHFWASDPRPYVDWLTDFNINFTCGFRMGGQTILPKLPSED